MDKKLDSILDELTRLSSNPSHTIFTNKQLQKILGVCPKTLQKWRDNGIIGFSCVGRTILYKLSDVLDMLERNYKKPFRA